MWYPSVSGTEHSSGGSSSGSVRAAPHPYGHQHSPVSPRTQDSVQQRPSVLHNTGGKAMALSEHGGSSVLRYDYTPTLHFIETTLQYSPAPWSSLRRIEVCDYEDLSDY